MECKVHKQLKNRLSIKWIINGNRTGWKTNWKNTQPQKLGSAIVKYNMKLHGILFVIPPTLRHVLYILYSIYFSMLLD